MGEQKEWQWQEPGTVWRGVGVYHVTLTVPSREPLLDTLVIPENDPSKARIERTALGNAIVNELYVMCRHYPEIRILQFCLMPDHLHAVIHVTQVMETSIRSVIRGYWQGVKKHGRAYTLSVAAELNSPQTNKEDKSTWPMGEGGYPFPVFTERPFIRPLSRRGQLHTMIHYVRMKPVRLATKRLEPGYFRVQKDVEIGGRKYDRVGNVALLLEEAYAPVHVRHQWVEKASHGDSQELRSVDEFGLAVTKIGGRCIAIRNEGILCQHKETSFITDKGTSLICIFKQLSKTDKISFNQGYANYNMSTEPNSRGCVIIHDILSFFV